jgi:hypothetical protein
MGDRMGLDLILSSDFKYPFQQSRFSTCRQFCHCHRRHGPTDFPGFLEPIKLHLHPGQLSTPVEFLALPFFVANGRPC